MIGCTVLKKLMIQNVDSGGRMAKNHKSQMNKMNNVFWQNFGNSCIFKQ